MKKPYTDPIFIGQGATERLADYISRNYEAARSIVVCDENTLKYAERLTPRESCVFPAGVAATDVDAAKIQEKARDFGGKPDCLIACGSGTVHDLTRFAAHAMGVPFIAYPTAASVDGFVSAIAAMTIGGRKISYPSTPPVALFADPEVFASAPSALTASGAGDIVGKYVSMFDWQTAALLGADKMDDEIFALVGEALEDVMKALPSDADYAEKVMRCLVLSGLSIQYYGSSRPASGAEHHLSHLWEMHCINGFTPALHGEKVGVSTLFVLERYKRLSDTGIVLVPKADRICARYLEPVYGALTDGIIEENTPYPMEGISQSGIDAVSDELLKLIAALPQPNEIRDYLAGIGAKTTLTGIALPDNREFIEKSLEYAPYARRRITMLKLI